MIERCHPILTIKVTGFGCSFEVLPAHGPNRLPVRQGDEMKRPWPERGIRGAKYLVAGAFLILATQPALQIARGNSLATAAVNFVFGVVGPLFLIVGFYLVGTRDKQQQKDNEK